jgi:hypothetical protein
MKKEAEDGNPVIVVHVSSSAEMEHMEHMYHIMQNTLRKKLKIEILPLFMQAVVLKWNTCTP